MREPLWYSRAVLRLSFLILLLTARMTSIISSVSNDVGTDMMLSSNGEPPWVIPNTNGRYLPKVTCSNVKAFSQKRAEKYFQIIGSFSAYRWIAQDAWETALICSLRMSVRSSSPLLETLILLKDSWNWLHFHSQSIKAQNNHQLTTNEIWKLYFTC